MASAPERAEIVVIGAGFGGLTTALILLRLGYRVTIVEKNRVPGGLTRGYERQGIPLPVGLHYVGSLAPGQPLERMLRYVGIDVSPAWVRMGQGGVVDRYLFDDFRFDFPEGIDVYAARLREAFPGEHTALSAFIAPLRELARKLESLEYLFSNGAGLLAPDDLETLEGRLRNLGCSVRLRQVLTVPCFWMGIPADQCPVIYHHLALLSYLLSAWRLRGTGTEFADHLAERVREQGGNLILGDPAAAVHLGGNGVAQVQLASGRPIKAAAAVAAIHPKLLLTLLPVSALSAAQSRRIRHLQDTYGMFAAHFAVDGLSHPPLAHNVFRIETDSEGRMTDVLFCQLLDTPVSGTTLLSLLTSSPQGEWAAWEGSRTGRRGVDYEQVKQAKADRLLQKVEQVFGSFSGARLLDSFTNLTLRDWVASPEGSAYGICRSQPQLFSAALLHRLPIRGLFLAGQNALAPGIFGTLVGSFHTVRQIIGPERFNREVAFRPEP